MHRKHVLSVTLLLGLFVAVLLQSTSAGRIRSYAVASVVYAVVIAISYYRGQLSIRYDPLLAVPAVLLWFVFLINLARNPAGAAPLRTITYIVFSGLNLFIIPATFTREEFADALSLVAAGAVVLAIPVAVPALVYDTGQAGVWGTGSFPPLTSVFTNPNDLAILSAFGLIASLGSMWSKQRVRWGMVCLFICATGLVLARGRAALLGAVAAVVLLTAYRYIGRRAVFPLVICGAVSAVFLVWVAVSGFLGPEATRTLFNFRAGLWRAAIRAIADQPLLGWGLVDDGQVIVDYGGPTPGGYVRSAHSSFFRMFIMTGIFGGILYLLLCAGAVVRGTQLLDRSTIHAEYFPLALLTVALIAGLFNNSPIFGLNFVAVFSALAFGYTSRTESTLPL